MEMLNIKEIQSPEDFTDILRTHGMDLPVEESMSELRKPISVGEKTIPNRICIQPLEGYDSCIDGSPSDLVYRRYRRFASSGAGLVWFESAAVADDGKSNPQQMMLSAEKIDDFGALLEEMDRICLEQFGFKQYKVLQLTHIQSIDYSWGEINFEYHPMNRELLMKDCMCEPCEAGSSYDVNMEPDDIEVSDTVTVIWEIG